MIGVTVLTSIAPKGNLLDTVLERAAEALSEHIPEGKRPPPSMFSAHIWAMSHGVVELFARGAAGGRGAGFVRDARRGLR